MELTGLPLKLEGEELVICLGEIDVLEGGECIYRGVGLCSLRL